MEPLSKLAERARTVNDYLYRRIGHGHITTTAQAVGMTRPHASHILNADEGYLNETGLARIEEYAERLRLEEQRAEAA